MYRFYCQDADFTKPTLVISDRHEIHHMKDVLRLSKGSVIQIFNAQSQQADAVIEQVKEQAVYVRIQKIKQGQEDGPRVILACAPPKKGKFEFIIEKCTELGVDQIIPLKTKRSEVVFNDDKMAGKLSRLTAVAVNAAKQSRRTRVPIIHPMAPLPKVLQDLQPEGLHLFASLHGPCRPMTEALLKAQKPKTVTIFIGPEGDFTPDEAQMAAQYGCMPVSLGDTVLKVDTAAMVAVALARFLR